MRAVTGVLFANRADAGGILAQRLIDLKDRNIVVVGLPRGGVPVAHQVAAALGAPLDVLLVRKLGVPFHPELAFGAIGEDGVRILNDDIVARANVSSDEIASIESRERQELERRKQRYRAHRGRTPLADRIVVIVDDGVATGSTAKAACEVARAEGAAEVILAVPVAPTDWTTRLGHSADQLIAVEIAADFRSVGQFYRDFSQTSDEEVLGHLEQAEISGG